MKEKGAVFGNSQELVRIIIFNFLQKEQANS
jgi:hypothetical protein